MANKKETLREMFDRAMADPDFTQSDRFKGLEKFSGVMDSLTRDIVAPCIRYAEEHGAEDDGWAHTVLISLARATCKVLYSLQHTNWKEDVFAFYRDELLPLCKDIAYRESDEMLSMKRKLDEQDEIPFDTKRDLILAVAVTGIVRRRHHREVLQARHHGIPAQGHR